MKTKCILIYDGINHSHCHTCQCNLMDGGGGQLGDGLPVGNCAFLCKAKYNRGHHFTLQHRYRSGNTGYNAPVQK
jgi:hypothetical protein